MTPRRDAEPDARDGLQDWQRARLLTPEMAERAAKSYAEWAAEQRAQRARLRALFGKDRTADR